MLTIKEKQVDNVSYNYDRVREVINKGCLKVLYL